MHVHIAATSVHSLCCSLCGLVLSTHTRARNPAPAAYVRLLVDRNTPSRFLASMSALTCNKSCLGLPLPFSNISTTGTLPPSADTQDTTTPQAQAGALVSGLVHVAALISTANAAVVCGTLNIRTHHTCVKSVPPHTAPTFGECGDEVEGQSVAVRCVLIHNGDVAIAPPCQQVCCSLALKLVRRHRPEEIVVAREGWARCCWTDERQFAAC